MFHAALLMGRALKKNAARFVEAVESTKTATLQLVFTPPSWDLLIIDDDEMEALQADLKTLQPSRHLNIAKVLVGAVRLFCWQNLSHFHDPLPLY